MSWRHPLGHELTVADWHDANACALGVLIGHAFPAPHGTPNGHLLFPCNASDAPVDFRLPAPKTGAVWQIVFDTARWRANDLGQSARRRRELRRIVLFLCTTRRRRRAAECTKRIFFAGIEPPATDLSFGIQG